MLHPTKDRLLAVSELKVLCGFPVDFKLGGSYEDRVHGLGNAVMPPMMAAVALSVRRIL
jgi:site-specific DNA-cytosine methylase